MRSGRFVRQLTGYVAFEPAKLPPEPPISLTGELAKALSAADLALGRLDGITGILPNPDLFVAMYVRQEAVLSSQIEGTQASLTDVLQFEAGDMGDGQLRDVQEVVNYVGAMNYGLEQTSLPLSLRLIREIHARLLRDVRGQHREPGEFRTSQNWIGPAGSTLHTAAFVPPPHYLLHDAMGNLEDFLYDESLPPLIHAGLAHAQFETIHPFLDGNGRVGRLLVTFLLCKRGILTRPLLYLSHFLKQHRAEYYDRLQAVRLDGAWEPWLLFFLRAVKDTATQAHQTAGKILELRTRCQTFLQSEGKTVAQLLRTLDTLFAHPVVTAATLKKKLGVSSMTANDYIARLERLKILRETTGHKRNRCFEFSPYLSLFEDGPTRLLDPDQLNLAPAPRTPLTEMQIRRSTAARETFLEFDFAPLSVWIQDLEQEPDPEHEIAIWEEMARAYETFLSSRDMSREARREAFRLLQQRTGMSAEGAVQSGLLHLSEDDANALLRGYRLLPHPVRVRSGDAARQP